MTSLVTLIRRSIAAFFAWWLGELAGLTPRRLRPASGRRRRGVVLALGQSETAVTERSAEGERTLGSVARDAPDHDQRLRALLRQSRRHARLVTLRLAGDLGLRKTLDLPLAARDDLDQLLRFEMDRLTPFRADEVYFAQRVLASDAAGRRIAVELEVVPKRVVEQALASAQRLGLSPARVELAAAPGGAEPLNLLGHEQGGGVRESRVTRALVLLALILAVIAVAIPLRRQQARLDELETRVASARAEAEESLALRARLDQLTESARFLVAEKTRRPMIAEVLAELTRLVPDRAHIVQLDLRDGSVQLHGYAAAASDLIGLLDQSKLFRTPQFRSPVTQDPRSGTERFHLSVELATGEEG
jgi:general secretion pathway protein L